MRLDGLVGNADVKKRLSSWFDSGRMPHALLIEGPTGSGRKTLASLLAAAMVCRHPDAKTRPCGICPSCIKAKAGTHPDISFFGGSERARSFGIQTVRDLREEGYRRPNESDCRVFVLVNAGALSAEAENALLRIMEEPPKHLRFILTCRSRFELLETIRSRVQTVTLSGVTEEEGLPLLFEKFPETAKEDLQTVLRLYGGCIGQAEDALADDNWKEGLRLAPALAEALLLPAEMPLLAKAAELPQRDPVFCGGVLRELRFLMRDALAIKYGGAERLSPSPETAEKLAAKLTAQQLINGIDAIALLEAMPRRNINHALFVTEVCARLRAAIGR